MDQKILLIDVNSLIHRLYHALPKFSGPQGKPTGALYGLSNILLKIFKEEPPDYIAAFFDRPEQTFREKLYEAYKIQRPKAADDLVSQIIEARNLLEKFGVKTFEAAGFEADDLIGTAVKIFKNLPSLKIVILTGDLDCLQLVDDDKVVVRITKKGISDTFIYNENEVLKRFDVPPQSLPDYKGLVGDASDNIPGVKGVGPKAAAPLIKKYGGLDIFLAQGQGERAYKTILAQKEIALLSKQLAVINQDVSLELNLSELKCKSLERSQLIEYFQKLGFESLVQRLKSMQPLLIQ